MISDRNEVGPILDRRVFSAWQRTIVERRANLWLQVTLSLCEEAFCASVGRQMELPPYEREREAEEHNTKNQ